MWNWIRRWRRRHRRANAEQTLMRLSSEIGVLDRHVLIALVNGEADKAKELLARANKLIRYSGRLVRVLYPRYFSK